MQGTVGLGASSGREGESQLLISPCSRKPQTCPCWGSRSCGRRARGGRSWLGAWRWGSARCRPPASRRRSDPAPGTSRRSRGVPPWRSQLPRPGTPAWLPPASAQLGAPGRKSLLGGMAGIRGGAPRCHASPGASPLGCEPHTPRGREDVGCHQWGSRCHQRGRAPSPAPCPVPSTHL